MCFLQLFKFKSRASLITRFSHISVNYKFGSNTQLQENSNKKYLTQEIRNLGEKTKQKNSIKFKNNSNTNGKSK